MIKIVIVWATAMVIMITFYRDISPLIQKRKPEQNSVTISKEIVSILLLLNGLVGIGYDEQISKDLLPYEGHDIQLDEIITESRIITKKGFY